MSEPVRIGDCLDVLPTLPAASVEACVTDPPYGLGFMGKGWDHGVPGVPYWTEVLRVLKPGAFLLAFGGTRTHHRLACAIEDAGFELRDTIGWIYAQGFPKSLDVSKGIDKAAGAEREVVGPGAYAGRESVADLGRMNDDAWEGGAARVETAPATPEARAWAGWGTALKPAWEPIIVARKPIQGTVAENVMKFGTGALNIDACRVSSMNGQRPHEVRTWEDEQPLCASCAEHAEHSGKPATPETRAFSATSNAEPTSSGRAETSQPDTGKTDIGCSDGMTAGDIATSSSIAASGRTPTDLFHADTMSTTSTRTEPTTGSKTCGSCGKPITSPITGASISVARKNLPRNGSSSAPVGRDDEPSANRRYTDKGGTNFAPTPEPRGGAPEGKWPANLIHDGSDEVLAVFPETGVSSGGGMKDLRKGKVFFGPTNPNITDACGFGDTGSAARFYYCAKASRAERVGSKHPTVKPLALMRYLCRLVTAPGGTVLDPFAGSGTTLQAAILEGFQALGIEKEPEYATDCEQRLAEATEQGMMAL